MARHPPQRKTKRLQTEHLSAAYASLTLLEGVAQVASPDPRSRSGSSAGDAEIGTLLQRRALAARRHRVAAGRRLGLGDTEMSALSLLACHGAMTASELGRLLFLSSGGVSALVGRLEQGGCVERRTHATDGRSAMVVITACFIARAAPRFAPLTAALDAVIQALEPTEEAVVARFLQEAARVVEEDAERLALRKHPSNEAEATVPAAGALCA
jgi:DNA-binding MarR family transcriptional regulator